MDNSSITTSYDRLVQTLAEMKARRGDRPIHPAESALLALHSKAITAGQHAGERAVRNIFKPYEYEIIGEHERIALGRRADEAAKIASAKARNRHVVASGVFG